MRSSTVKRSLLWSPVFGLAPHGLIGLVLVAVFWILNWTLPGMRTHVLFFPLWLGYILTVDAIVLRRRGSSLLTRSPAGFVLLFLASAPAWWLFELLNWRTGNWQYSGRGQFSGVEYFLLATVSFSTVVPAVFETAELVRSFDWMRRLYNGPRLGFLRSVYRVMPLVGFAMLGLALIWPDYFYPLVWGWVFFIIEPINARRGRRSLIAYVGRGDWRPVVALALGALVCGFFWEMWNYYSFPKWTYNTPGVEFLYVFEMPLLGFIGYLPFAFELYAIAHLLLPRQPDLRL